MEQVITGKEFSEGWKHFLSCIDWKKTFLDGEAIQFMNEVPFKIIQALNELNGD